MKVRIIQPAYSTKSEDLQKCFDGMIALMEECNEPLDLIVMPEWCEISSAQSTTSESRSAIHKYNAPFMQKAIEMAKRCHAVTFVNCGHFHKNGIRNTTHAIDRNGNIVGRYYKAHPAPREDKPISVGGSGIDSSYTDCFDDPYIVEIEGVRYGFLTCYDFYMYEEFPQIARKNVDIIIGCSHQRSDTHQALSIINRFLCYNTNAYLVRASVSLGEDSPIGGGSCIIAPNGDIITDMKSKIGYETHEINPNAKYYKPAGFRGVLKAHYEYIEDSRRPWLYRNGGRAIVQFDERMSYPRLCAHRGFNTVAPENSLPAFGSAIALGAQEIEFDVWATKDGVLVSCHDDTLDRVSDGTGKICDYTYEELLNLDFGAKHGEKFRGLKIPTFENILQKFAGQAIMNIHVKIWDNPANDDKLEEIVALIRKYDCEKHCYFMSSNDEQLKKAKAYAPAIGICVGAGKRALEIVDRAIAIGANKVQFLKPNFNLEMIEKAHANGIKCNVFWSDDPTEAKEFLEMGIDCILTNDYLAIKKALNM